MDGDDGECGRMDVVALTGFSGSGKTTLIIRLIEHFISEGKRVGAIKHTHHPLNEEVRGDTGRFQAAGANPVILAREGEAVIFTPEGTSRTTFARPGDLLSRFTTDIVLVEGFKHLGEWPQISISADARPSLESVLTELDRIWRS